MYFSVVIPVYNVENYLKECVNSILVQTYSDFELILVDDGSKDLSGKICDEYAAKDSRVKVIHKENGGQSTARNAGTRAASGEYIIYLDSDDKISDSNFLMDVRNVSKGYDIVKYRYCKYYPDKLDDCHISMSGLQQLSKADLIYELVRRDAFFCSAWSKAIRLELLKENNISFDENLCCEDMDWYYNVILAADKITVIDKPYVFYRQRENSVTSSFKEKSVTDFIYTIDLWYSKFSALEDGKERTALLSSLAKLYCNLIIVYSRHTTELKKVKSKIFSYKALLNYDMNPRTKMIHKVSKIVGLDATCRLLQIADKIK